MPHVADPWPLTPFQPRRDFSRHGRRIGRPADGAADGDAADPGGHDLGQVAGRDAADGKGRQTDFLGHRPQERNAGKRRELLRPGGKRRPDADVVGPVEDRLPRLLDRMRGNPDQGLGPDDRPGVLDREVALAEEWTPWARASATRRAGR